MEDVLARKWSTTDFGSCYTLCMFIENNLGHEENIAGLLHVLRTKM